MLLKKMSCVFCAAAALLALMVFVLSPVTTVLANEPPPADSGSSSDVSSGASSGTSSDASSSSSTPTNAGAIEIVSYEPLPTVISKNMAVTFNIMVRDTRPEVVNEFNARGGDLHPVPRVNSITFVPSADAHIEGISSSADAAGKAGVYYSVIAPTTYSGYGKSFQCDISYAELTNIPVSQISLTVNQAVEWQEPSSSSSSSSSTSVRGTNFVVRSSSYGESSIAAGASFTLSIEAMTTNGTYPVDNVTASLTLPKEITFASGTSTVYVGLANPNQVFNASFQLLASAVAAEGSYTVSLQLDGVNANTGEKATDKIDLTIPIHQPERFEILSATVPDYINAGMEDMGYGTVNIINKGLSDVHNVMVTVAGGDLYLLDGDVYIGTVKGNT